jgi:hypothetical protein
MIILIDTEDKVIEVEGVNTSKETKKIIRETLKNFDDFEHIITPSIEIKIIPINTDFIMNNFFKNFTNLSGDKKNSLDIKPGPPKQ